MIHGVCGGVAAICSKRLWNCGQRPSIDWWRINCTSNRRRFVRSFMKVFVGDRFYFVCADRIPEIYIWPHNTHVKNPLFFHFNQQQNVSTNICKNPKMRFHEHPVGAELFCADGQTDGRTEIRSFAKTPKMLSSVVLLVHYWPKGTKILLVRLLKWSYWEETGVCIKLQMVFESIWWSAWLTGFQTTGFLQPSQRNKIYVYNFFYSLEKCTITYMSIIFQHYTTAWGKGKWIWKNYEVQSRKNKHINVGII
jgi:hypothetical protein